MSEKTTAFQQILNDRFGMFVHYGIYSEMAGIYKGRECEGIGEWIQLRLEIPVAEYEEFGRKYFLPKPEFSKEPVQNGDILSLGVLWAGKVTEGNEDEKPEKLKYEKNTYIPDYGKNGLAVNKNCHAYFWDDSREIMCWDACFEKAGKYRILLKRSKKGESIPVTNIEFKKLPF